MPSISETKTYTELRKFAHKINSANRELRAGLKGTLWYREVRGIIKHPRKRFRHYFHIGREKVTPYKRKPQAAPLKKAS